MFKLREISQVFSGVAVRESKQGSVHFMRLADLTTVKAGQAPNMVLGNLPGVARALPIKDGDLVVAARGTSTDVCTASKDIFGAYISLDLYLVRPRPTVINSEYLRAFLELPATQAALASEKQGSGLARLPKEALEKTTVPIPPLYQQRLIAGLSLSLEDEQKLLNRLGDLRECLTHEAISRALRGKAINFSGRSE